MKSGLKNIVRKLGYLSDSRGIINRYINTDAAWDEHLASTKKFIIKAVSGRNIENLAVYGSGWLLDFPLEEVAHFINHIRLYDVVHPPQVLQKIKKYKNVTAITEDITGGALQEACELVRNFKKTGHKPDPAYIFRNRFIPDPVPDYSISLNLLSQIGDIVTGYLGRHMLWNDYEVSSMIGILQQSHLDLLKPGYSCLITDVTEKHFNMQGNLQASKELIKCSLPLTHKSESWEWQFDPSGDYMPGLKTISRIIAVEI